MMRDQPEFSESNSNTGTAPARGDTAAPARGSATEPIEPQDAAADRYLALLSLPAERRHAWLAHVEANGNACEPQAQMRALHAVVAQSGVDCHDPAAVSIEARLAMAAGPRPTVVAEAGAGDSGARPHVVTMPPVNRGSIAPDAWPRGIWRARSKGAETQRTKGASPQEPTLQRALPRLDRRVQRAGMLRRWGLIGLTLAQTYLATDFMTTVLPYQGRQPLEIGILVLFAILFGWVSAGFWTAAAGFVLLLFGKDRYAISARNAGSKPIDPAARTAVVMPICNEDVSRVFAGLRATYESLERSGELRHFDLFVLSDTHDADVRVAEQKAWLAMCRDLGAFGRVFYRWRRHRIKRKSGNVADFCRRWGKNYRYMVVMDADSVMTGECLVRLVQTMEAAPDAGIIQTIPRAAGRDTLHARIQQFAASVYGPLFAAGLHFWQLGESHYWGHNAIIRVEPFMRYCALRRLPGKGVFSGEILSHDFVEAALMRRAGWGVWIAYDLPGSYEEMPPNLMDEIKRDRRWCQGNLMNFRLVTLEGVHSVHRAVFMTGVMAYASAPLWFAALVLATALLAVHTLAEPVYFVQPYQLFPLWPEWRPERAIALFSTTLSLLFLPKLLSMVIVLKHGARSFGGALRLGASIFGEMIVSALLAPIRMLFHTQFVTAALAGHSVQWKSPPREDAETSWTEAVQRHGWQTLVGMLWVAGVYWLDPAHVWWLLPVAGAMILSIPLSVGLSRASFGRALRRAGLFLVPEERQPPRELAQTARLAKAPHHAADFVRAVVDPLLNAEACALAPRRQRSGKLAQRHAELVRRACTEGPKALATREKLALLDDAQALSLLHFQVWSSAQAAPGWAEGMAQLGQAHAAPHEAPNEPHDARWLPSGVDDLRACAVPALAGSTDRARSRSMAFLATAGTGADSPAPFGRPSA
jgi:membrane glycosyltransferase